jgi:signal transduction histidine kinase
VKRPWHAWFLYGLSLAVAIAALGWLTASALRLERNETATRARSERDERVRLALWRMDTRVMPLVAQEAARKYDTYSTTSAQPLSGPSDYVVLHFEVSADGVWHSPEYPGEQGQRAAVVARDNIDEGLAQLALLEKTLDRDKLLKKLPHEALSSVALAATSTMPPLKPTEDDPFADNTPPAGAKVAAKQGSDDFLKRQAANISNVASNFVQQRAPQFEQPASRQPATVSEGMTRGLWVGDQLLLARRVNIADLVLLQGCLLDWKKLQRDLRAEVADLIDQFTLQPLSDAPNGDGSFALATLPVRLVVPELAVEPAGLTPLRTSLVIAWLGFALAATAIGLSLFGMISLGQRRAAFVSAVTHELRTPLTTFRMYAEMLEENMVTDPKQRQDYLHTLRVEADRLAHLVENVLAYARVERGRHATNQQHVTLDELWNRIEGRLSDRAQRSGMKLVHSIAGAAGVALWTDPTAVEQILFNLVDNAAKYASRAADRTIEVRATADQRAVTISVRDHGPGIAPDAARRLFRPFSKSAQEAAHTAPGVGLGLSLCRRLARQLGGDLRHESQDGPGVTFSITLPCT